MALFESKDRTRTHPMKRGERNFDFYDSIGGKSFETFRGLVNLWISEFPAAEQNEVILRMRKGSNDQFDAAMVETVFHAFLKRLNYGLTIHPRTPKGKNIDFLIEKDGSKIGYLECTSFSDAREKVAGDNREAQICNAIERVKIPADCRFGYSLEARGQSGPNLKKLISDVEMWVKCEKGERPRRVFKADDWKIELTLFRGFKENSDSRNIAAAFGEVRWVSGSSEIRAALEEKANRYGDLEASFLIAVADFKNELTGDNAEDLFSALFGDEAVRIKMSEDGNSVLDSVITRKANGFWGHPDKPKNKHVSAVILVPSAQVWTFKSPKWQPLLVENPWAEQPLKRGAAPICRYHLEGDQTVFTEANFGDLLELPNPWPPKN